MSIDRETLATAGRARSCATGDAGLPASRARSTPECARVLPGLLASALFAAAASTACSEAPETSAAVPGDTNANTNETLDGGATSPPDEDASSSTDASTPNTTPDPVVFVHGINGSSADFAVMIERLVADGWPRERLLAIDYADPKWGCNVDNANALATRIEELRAKTGAKRIDLVAHSMGTLSSRRFVKLLGGANVVATYVTLGGMHHGVNSACLNPLPVCVWQELCGTGPYLTALNEAPTTPGPVKWVSIYSKSDDTVDAASAHLEGAENIPFDGVDHAGANGLLERPEVYAEVKRVLGYPVP